MQLRQSAHGSEANFGENSPLSQIRTLAYAAASGLLVVTLSCARHARHEPGPRIDPDMERAIANI